MIFAIVCASAGLKEGANGEKGEKDFEDGSTGIVLVGGFDVAG